VASPIQNTQGEFKRGRASHSEATKERSREAKPLFHNYSPSPLKKRDTKGAFKRGEASLP